MQNKDKTYHNQAADLSLENNRAFRKLQLSAEYGLWKQDYCGCVYSIRK
ncbi:MAG: epoxyqueuosine reductase QueH [Treponema sp.]|nr:epoxyqueuosine reductase QueH [Treponema sp.]